MAESFSCSLPDVLLLTEPRFTSLFDVSVFPNRLCMKRSRWSALDVITLFFIALLAVLQNKHRVILFAGVSSTDKQFFDIVKLFATIKRVGGFRNVRLILWSAKSYSTKVGKIIGSLDYNDSNAITKFVTLYKSIEISHPELKKKLEFVPFPAWQIKRIARYSRGNYVFTGGEAQRDFKSLFAAIDGLSIPVRLRTLGEGVDVLRTQIVPSNCEICVGHRWHNSAEEFIKDMLGSRFVVVPLLKTG